ncbi:MAG: hypothetical protein ACI4EN_09650 [Butyrivibrio sp.]
MRIELKDKLNKKLIYNDNYIKRISMTDNKIVKLLSNISFSQAEEVRHILNSINNQNIENIDFDRYKYTHRGIELGFSELSKAEKVFMIAAIADMKKYEIWLHTDITQLTKSTLKKFIKRFYESEYVNIVYDSDISTAFYNAMVKEAIND